jgi:hypothetical protein
MAWGKLARSFANTGEKSVSRYVIDQSVSKETKACAHQV